MGDRPTYRVVVEREDQLWTAVVQGFEPGTVGATDTDPGALDSAWSYVQREAG